MEAKGVVVGLVWNGFWKCGTATRPRNDRFYGWVGWQFPVDNPSYTIKIGEDFEE